MAPCTQHGCLSICCDGYVRNRHCHRTVPPCRAGSSCGNAFPGIGTRSSLNHINDFSIGKFYSLANPDKQGISQVRVPPFRNNQEGITMHPRRASRFGWLMDMRV